MIIWPQKCFCDLSKLYKKTFFLKLKPELFELSSYFKWLIYCIDWMPLAWNKTGICRESFLPPSVYPHWEGKNYDLNFRTQTCKKQHAFSASLLTAPFSRNSTTEGENTWTCHRRWVGVLCQNICPTPPTFVFPAAMEDRGFGKTEDETGLVSIVNHLLRRVNRKRMQKFDTSHKQQISVSSTAIFWKEHLGLFSSKFYKKNEKIEIQNYAVIYVRVKRINFMKILKGRFNISRE